jgi:hypothetical protein
MSTLEPAASPQAPADGSNLRSDRLRVITAGRVGGMEAQLGASGFDVVAAAETEDALIDAVSADEPDAIVVEADLCASLEQVRDLAPDALLIVIGDHTPAGALGRIEQGVSGTVMAGLLHALVAEGIGAAAVWGLVPAFGQGAGLHIPQRMSGSLLSAKADLVRAFLVNALREPAELVTVASTIAVTVSASLLLTVSAVRPHERPSRVPSPAPTVERAPQHPVAAAPTTPTPVHGPSGGQGEPGDKPAPNRGKSGGHGHDNDQGGGQGGVDQGGDQGGDDQGGGQGGDQGGDDQGGGQGGDQGGDDQGGGDQGGNDQGGNQDNDDQGGNQGGDDQGGNQGGDDQGGNQGGNDQGGNQGGNDQGENQGGDDQGEDH